MMAKPKVVVETRTGGSRMATVATLAAAAVLGALGGGLVGAGVGETTESTSQLSGVIEAVDTVAKDLQGLITDVQRVGDQVKAIARAPASIVPVSSNPMPSLSPSPAPVIVKPTVQPTLTPRPTPAPTPRPTPTPTPRPTPPPTPRPTPTPQPTPAPSCDHPGKHKGFPCK